MSGRGDTSTVLVMDGWFVKELAVLRTLKRHGLRVLIAAPDNVRSFATRSRHCDGVVLHPPLERETEVVEYLRNYLRRDKVDVVLPLDDPQVLLLARHRASIEEFTTVAMPPNASLEIALDKRKTVEAAAKVDGGIPVPHTYTIGDLKELSSLAIDRFPVVIKPRTSWGALGIRYVRNAQELTATYLEVHREYPYPLIQEFVQHREGEKYQMLYLFDAQGDLSAWYMHRVIAQRHDIRAARDGSPVRGGSALFWKSCRDDNLLARGRRLLEALDWRGFGFVECVRDTAGVPVLLEINARLSGTISLPLARGVDFAHGACLIAMGGQPALQLDYRVGSRAKHTLMSFDDFLQTRRWSDLPRFLDPRYRTSAPLFSDPVPILNQYWSALRRLRSKLRQY